MAPVVEPDLDQARVVLVDDAARAAGERVWRHLAEHVTHVRARVDVQRAAALPHLCARGTASRCALRHRHRTPGQGREGFRQRHRPKGGKHKNEKLKYYQHPTDKTVVS